MKPLTTRRVTTLSHGTRPQAVERVGDVVKLEHRDGNRVGVVAQVAYLTAALSATTEASPRPRSAPERVLMDRERYRVLGGCSSRPRPCCRRGRARIAVGVRPSDERRHGSSPILVWARQKAGSDPCYERVTGTIGSCGSRSSIAPPEAATTRGPRVSRPNWSVAATTPQRPLAARASSTSSPTSASSSRSTRRDGSPRPTRFSRRSRHRGSTTGSTWAPFPGNAEKHATAPRATSGAAPSSQPKSPRPTRNSPSATAGIAAAP